MDKNHGYVRLYRSLLSWGWYSDANTMRVFVHCILKANFTEKEWRGIKIPAGSFVTSLKSLSKELKMSVKQLRTAINHLKTTHEITHKPTRNFSIISVTRYNDYQTMDTQNGTQEAHKRHTNGTQWATTNKRNKEKREEYNVKEIFENLRKNYKEQNGHI